MNIVLKGAWKPFRNDFEQHLINFRRHSRQIDEEARLAHRIESARVLEIQLANQALQIRSAQLERRHLKLSFIPAVDYLGKHSRLTNIRHPGTNQWLQTSPEFCAWLAAQGTDCLCCYGIPGSGKSVLAASVVDVLLAKSSSTAFVVCHYYCDYAEAASLDPYNLIASILRQILQHIPVDKFDDDFECPFGEAKPRPALEAMVQFLIKILKDFDEAFIVLDGVDEIAQDNQTIVLSFVDNLLRQHPTLKIFLACRIEEHRIKKAMEPFPKLTLSQAYIGNDIVLFIKDHVKTMGELNPLTTDESLRAEVIDLLAARAAGM